MKQIKKINYAIIGGGWRARFYLRISRALPDLFNIIGMVVRNAEKGKVLEEEWGVNTYRNIDELLEANEPEFVVVSVPWDIAPKKSKILLEKGIPVLSETPPAPDLEGLKDLYEFVTDTGTKYQVAEQYHLQPLHAARIKLVERGLVGKVNQIQISVCHGYHAISLIRKFMDLDFENCEIKAQKFVSTILEGPGKKQNVEKEKYKESEQILATLNFGDKLALYDFTDEQYFSQIRPLRLTVRGEKGEINDNNIKYLKDYQTPVDIDLKRVNKGENGNLDGYFFKGILAGDEWVYRNLFIPGRISDDEIAIASCLYKMAEYVRGGSEFYGLADAAQDHYLALMINKAVSTGKTVVTETQPWA